MLSPERRVIFLDADARDAAETKVGDAFSNAAEAEVLGQIVTALAACGVPLADICLVAPYRPQVRQPRLATIAVGCRRRSQDARGGRWKNACEAYAIA